MKRTFTKYPSNISSAKHIKYETTHMTYDGETPKEIVDTLKSVIVNNQLKWFYGLNDITIHWDHPFPALVCKDDRGSTVLIGKPKPFTGPITWYYSEPRTMDAEVMREIAYMLDVLNKSEKLNDLITNFEEYYGEEQ